MSGNTELRPLPLSPAVEAALTEYCKGFMNGDSTPPSPELVDAVLAEDELEQLRRQPGGD